MSVQLLVAELTKSKNVKARWSLSPNDFGCDEILVYKN